MSDLVAIESAFLTTLSEINEELEEGRVPDPAIVQFACEQSDEAELKRYRYAGMIQFAKRMEEYLEAESDALLKRKKQLERTRKWVEGQIVAVMGMHGITKLEANGRWIAARKNPDSVFVGDVDELPADMVRVIPEEREPDKVKIKAALKAGVPIPGVSMIPGEMRLEIGPRTAKSSARVEERTRRGKMQFWT